MNILSSNQLLKIFNINNATLDTLINRDKIPRSNGQFSPAILSDWLRKGPQIMTEEDIYLEQIRREWEEQFPEAMAAIRDFDRKLMASQEQKRKKDYYLVKVSNKKHGFLYYVRYIDNGQLLPSKWSTKTNDPVQAESFAVQFREQIISEYRAACEKKQAPAVQERPRQANPVPSVSIPSPIPVIPAPDESIDLYSTLEKSYKKDSDYLNSAQNRGRVLDKKTRSVYDHFMNKRLIPFLLEQQVTSFAEITPSVIFNFQEYLLTCGNTAETINRYLGSVKSVFDYLFMTGRIYYNVFDQAKMLKTDGRKAKAARGCFDIDTLKGIFTEKWNNFLHYLLCLMIYSTGMRNSELERLRVKDIVQIEDCYFIDVVKSKTGNGIRKVPLHPFVFDKLKEFTKNLTPESYIFSANGNHNQSTLYRNATIDLGQKAGFDAKKLDEQKITFYSGRHFWKTLMNSENIGDDIEEYFMGHKVSGDVAKLYNHRDKQGKERIAEKAREVFRALDKRLFR
jgi:integrase